MKKNIYFLLGLILVSIITIFTFYFTEQNKQTIRIGYIPVTHCLPLYIAVENGVFKKNNMDVELVPLQGGGKILEALIAGDIDIGFSNVVSILMANRQGKDIIPITGGPIETVKNKDHAIMVLKSSKIITPFDLKGKFIAINQRQNIDHLMLKLFLEKYDLKISDVHLVEVPFPRMEGALESGSVDAIATAEPFVTIGTIHGKQRVLGWNYCDVRERTFVSTYVVTKALSEKKKDIISKFVAIIGKSSFIANNDREKSIEALIKYMKIDKNIAEKVSLPYFSNIIDYKNIKETDSLLVNNKFY